MTGFRTASAFMAFLQRAGGSQEPEALFGKSGPFLLMRGIHHVKLVLAGGRFEQVKAYVFMLLLGSMPAGLTSAPSSP